MVIILIFADCNIW